ncbi:MAG: hypothetical protein A2Y62_17650 [Candidatus Fischerbacteria bacterium RBG_13_37_8]|uniref:Ferredoxin n=1 Tax=Candidatus Fischerbacteria bacterium RBG_13_37_8 TaxID=1817863 RepID=A0A1F5VP34_9BACT|nr:MAG: hypothetical protein A2Y62_17650 [Candidatus Fischerbacteria bacterium RBG_13_37_8]
MSLKYIQKLGKEQGFISGLILMNEKTKYVPTIYIDETRCDGKMACMRICPTYAIRVKQGAARIINNLCIDCGECIKVCPNKAIKPITNTFKDINSIGPVYAVASPALYAQFGKDIHPHLIHEGLRRIGFAGSYDITKYCVILRRAIERFISESKGQKPVISSHCPVIVSMIEVQFPSLIENLLPMREPRELAAIEIKKNLNNKDAALIYVTPCSAKILDVKSPRWKEGSSIDGALSIRDIYNPLLSAILEIKNPAAPDIQIYAEGIEWAAEGGIVDHLPESVLSLSSSGIANAKKVLSDIEFSKLREIDFVELYACDSGCSGGSLVVENTYMARNKIKSIISLPSMAKDTIPDYAEVELKREWLGLHTKQTPVVDLHSAIGKMKDKERIYLNLPKVDCGLCGCPTCSVFADDIVNNKASLNECIFEELSQMKKDFNLIFQRWKQE